LLVNFETFSERLLVTTEVSDMLASNSLSLPPEMVRLPKDGAHQLSPGEASFTLKIEAEATLAKTLGDGALGDGVSVYVEEVAAGADDELFIRYLPFVATSAEVEELFGAHGNIVKVRTQAIHRLLVT
jgi:hypothetical protein